MKFFTVTYYEEDAEYAEYLAWTGNHGFATIKREKNFKNLAKAEEWAKNNFSEEKFYTITTNFLNFEDD